MPKHGAVSPLADAVFHSSPDSWRYISEGKQHIVFAFDGGSKCKPEHAALLLGRVLKLSKSVLRSAQSYPAPTRSALVDRLAFMQRYTSAVMRPLFAATDPPAVSVDDSTAFSESSHDWFDTGCIIWLPSSLAESLLRNAYPLRSEARRKQFDMFHAVIGIRKGPGEGGAGMLPAVVLEDYTSPLHLHLKQPQQQDGAAGSPSASTLSPSLPPTICIELKPKWGFLPAHGSPEKRTTCRFCMHQYSKLLHGEVPSHSHFCPLDLFSCHEERVERAVEELFRTPQNNLRIFVREGTNTTNVRNVPNSSSSTSSASHVTQLDMCDEAHVDRLTRILFPHLGDTPIKPGSTPVTLMYDQRSLLKSFLVAFICQRGGPIRAMLRRLATLQRTLDAYDVERVWIMVERRREKEERERKAHHVAHSENNDASPTGAVSNVGDALEQQHSSLFNESSTLVPNNFTRTSTASAQHSACGPAPPRPEATYAGLHPLKDAEEESDPKWRRRAHLWKGLVPDEVAAEKKKHVESASAEAEHVEVDWLNEIISMVKSNSNQTHSVTASASHAGASPSSNTEAAAASYRHFEFQARLEENVAKDPHGGTDDFPVCRSKEHTSASVTPLPAFDASSSASSSDSSLDVDESSLLTILRAFLIATTLKDVSLMSTLQPITTPATVEGAPPAPLSTRVNYSVRLIDLEVKAIGKLLEYWTQDRDIVEQYRQEVAK
jgi:hypothetical protein